MMKISCTTFGLVVVGVLFSILTTAASAALIDDFSDGDDVGWTHLDGTVGKPWGPGIFDAKSGVYHFESQDVVTEQFSGILQAYLNDGLSSGFLRATVRADIAGTNPFLIFRDHPDSPYEAFEFYAFGADPSNGLFFIDGGAGQFTFGGLGPLDFQVEQDWVIEAGVVSVDDGVELSMRVWRVGEDEPSSPQLVVGDPTPVEEGLMGLGAWVPRGNAITSATFDDIYLRPEIPIPGDFNNDLSLDATDIDFLSIALRAGIEDVKFDVTLDGHVDARDHNFWVTEIKGTYYGDADLNGEFNSSDLVAVLAAGQYEDGIAGNSGWAKGDFDGDSDFTSSDLVTALADGGYEQGPRPAATAVPEPNVSLLALMAAMVGISPRLRRCGHREAPVGW